MFVSYGFLGFLALLLVLYYIVPKRMQWLLLLVANVLFYFSAGTFYPIYLLVTAVTVWYAAIRMDRCEEGFRSYERQVLTGERATPSREEKKAYREKMNRRKKRWMLAALFFNLGILAVVKYTNFAIVNLNLILRAAGSRTVDTVNLLVPLGISFYTFQAVSYLLDVYWKRCTVQKDLPRFVLYVSFFPQLIQGPISRYGDLSKSLYEEHSFDRRQMCFGLERILWGYFKKLVVADRIAVALEMLTSDPDYYTGGFVFLEMVFYALQLYADFSGGIDITIGIAQCLGIDVKENFIRPFFSKNIAEYWRRWHISMGTWFRDYVFYPSSVSRPVKQISGWAKKHFGRNAGRRVSVWLATLICWLATGIWHGASWNYVVWGLLNGIVILISQELEPLYERFHQRFPALAASSGYQAFQVVRTFLLTCCLLTLYNYKDVGLAFHQLVCMVTKFRLHGQLSVQELLNLGLSGADYVIVLVSVLLMFFVSMAGRRESVRACLSRKPYAVRCCIYMTLFFATLLLGRYGVGFDAQQFIYNQF